MSATQYPNYETTDGETFDFPFNGAGNKQIRHKIPTDHGEIHVTVYTAPARSGEPSALLDVAHDFPGPNGHVRLNVPRSDMSNRIIDGRDFDN